MNLICQKVFHYFAFHPFYARGTLVRAISFSAAVRINNLMTNAPNIRKPSDEKLSSSKSYDQNVLVFTPKRTGQLFNKNAKSSDVYAALNLYSEGNLAPCKAFFYEALSVAEKNNNADLAVRLYKTAIKCEVVTNEKFQSQLVRIVLQSKNQELLNFLIQQNLITWKLLKQYVSDFLQKDALSLSPSPNTLYDLIKPVLTILPNLPNDKQAGSPKALVFKESFNELLYYFAYFQHCEGTKHVLQLLNQLGISLSTMTLTKFVFYTLCSHGEVNAALQLYNHQKKEGLLLPGTAAAAIIEAFCSNGMPLQALTAYCAFSDKLPKPRALKPFVFALTQKYEGGVNLPEYLSALLKHEEDRVLYVTHLTLMLTALRVKSPTLLFSSYNSIKAKPHLLNPSVFEIVMQYAADVLSLQIADAVLNECRQTNIKPSTTLLEAHAYILLLNNKEELALEELKNIIHQPVTPSQDILYAFFCFFSGNKRNDFLGLLKSKSIRFPEYYASTIHYELTTL
ncbi:hypothetical protein SJAG_04959 [Schizosaccharomyces japonicus yFS275]|uniref:Uncharacterized protein n=1 Tax=Schizosaccharomyces japonicus (strain yFS275 / FY16936) TaxID=402676 RepID=B6K880_SCHJY|nr:hypothetical protein SJAG_04959 [Schizosaccharomyces japonicus yFS275]EEB09734.2 hypothetical protein SJAG_04959 [Schizosaccharomyces japonicus yFS275]